MKLRPTRPSVARFREFSPHKWETQKQPIRDIKLVEANTSYIREFFKDNNAARLSIGSTTHSIIKNCPIDKIIKLLEKVDTTKCDWESSYYFEYLRRLSEGGKLENIDFVLMGEGKLRLRELYPGDKMNIMQGPSSNYPGDRYFHEEKIQLQVHFVECKPVGRSPAFKTVAFALYIPNKPEFDMSYIIREDL